MDFKSAPVFIR